MPVVASDKTEHSRVRRADRHWGVLYDHYVWGVVAFSVGGQIAAIPVFFIGSIGNARGRRGVRL